MTNLDVEQRPPAVRCQGLSRSFGPTHALRDVNLEVRAGTVHSFVGANGAGKSTCLGIIAGRITATAGEVVIFGEGLRNGTPRSAHRLGVVAVHQELIVIPQLTPQENVFISEPASRWGFISRRQMRQRYEALCESLEIAPAPNVAAQELAVAAQQLIEIERAVGADAQLILLDEPTTALSPAERDALFRVVATLRNRGKTVILVSHNLEEVLANSDEITVFRDGQVVESKSANEWTKAGLVQSMLGEDAAQELIDAESNRSVRVESSGGDSDRSVRLEVRNLSLSGRLDGVDFDVHEGEVLGIAGLMGSGRTSLVRALAGAEPGASGSLKISGTVTSWPRAPRASRRLGISLIPEDRKTQGLSLSMSVADNVALPDYGKVARLSYVSPRRLLTRVTPLLHRAGVDGKKFRVPVGTLSGGNQQKVLFARMRYMEPRILLCDEPTRGIDVGTKTSLLHQIRNLARDEGLAIVLVSSELEEVIGFSDRILVLAGGRRVALLDNRNSDVTMSDVLPMTFGGA